MTEIIPAGPITCHRDGRVTINGWRAGTVRKDGRRWVHDRSNIRHATQSAAAIDLVRVRREENRSCSG